MDIDKDLLKSADVDFCMNTIREANKRGEYDIAAAYAQRLLYLQLEKLNSD